MRVAVAAVAACSGCKVLDDDEPPPIDSGGDATGGHVRSCVGEALEGLDTACPPPRQWWLEHMGAKSKAVLIDDPEATIGVGPGAWLVRVDSETDYVGTYNHVDEDCDVACGWCLPGQHMCHTGRDAQGEVDCWACIDLGTPNPGMECVAALEACNQDGVDETSGGTTEAIGEYDCTTWRPEEGVRRSNDGMITIDAAMVQEVLLYQGEPLASCDDTRFRRRPDGYFEISKLGEHGLLAAMGLAQGDTIRAMNGKPLNTFDAVMQAAGSLTDGASFTATIDRGDVRFDMRVSVR